MTRTRFTGRTALVTGAGSGIGRAVALALAVEGADVVVAGRRQEPLEETVRLIEEAGGKALAVTADVSRAADVQAVVDAAVERFGSLDVAVNNAGVFRGGQPLAELPEAHWHEQLAINVTGVALALQAQVRQMRTQPSGGAIVNIASVAGIAPSPFIAAYGVSKAAMINLTAQLAHEFAPKVRVNAIAPAVVKTKFAQALYEGREAEAAASYPLGRLGVPSDIGGATAFLTSAQSDWITGQTLVIDGGIFLNAGVG